MDANRRPRRRPGFSAPAEMSDAIRPDYNEHMTLQEAAASVVRLARFEPAVVSELPGESLLRIEVNGLLAGVVRCLPDAPVELAVGWAFMHGFFHADALDSVTEHEERVSLMVDTDIDVDRQRLRAVGWREEQEHEDAGDEIGYTAFVVHADVLMGVVHEALRVMARDRSVDGFVHAAVGTDTGIQCVARDREPSLAVAKVIGWALRDGRGDMPRILVLRGMVDRLVVEAAARCGLCILATTGIPTADAFRAATGSGVSMLGMVSGQRPGLFVDAGHVIEEDPTSNEALP